MIAKKTIAYAPQEAIKTVLMLIWANRNSREERAEPAEIQIERKHFASSSSNTKSSTIINCSEHTIP